MSWLISISVAILAGVIALVCMLLATLGFVDWYHIPGREGASGYFVIIFSLLAGIIGTILALIVARIVGPGFVHQLLWAGGINVGICALIAGVGFLFGDHSGEPSVDDPRIAYEELEAAKGANEQDAFDAIPQDAPITAWFPYTGDPPPQ